MRLLNGSHFEDQSSLQAVSIVVSHSHKPGGLSLAKHRKRRSRALKEPEWYLRQAVDRDGEDWKSLWCPFCRKVTWHTKQLAEAKVAEMKADSTTKKPYMLDSYQCPR